MIAITHLYTWQNGTDLACSKRSDSGERHELGKASEKTRWDWGEGNKVRPFSPSLFRFLFSAPLPYSLRPSPLSECLEQASWDQDQTTNLYLALYMDITLTKWLVNRQICLDQKHGCSCYSALLKNMTSSPVKHSINPSNCWLWTLQKYKIKMTVPIAESTCFDHLSIYSCFHFFLFSFLFFRGSENRWSLCIPQPSLLGATN